MATATATKAESVRTTEVTFMFRRMTCSVVGVSSFEMVLRLLLLLSERMLEAMEASRMVFILVLRAKERTVCMMLKVGC